MLASEQSSLAKLTKNILMYKIMSIQMIITLALKGAHIWGMHTGRICNNLVYVNGMLALAKNNIGAEGCQYLNKAHWPKLQEIYLRKEFSII